MTRLFALAVVAALALVLGLPPAPAFASMRISTVDPTARLNGTGSYALVTGPLVCDSGEDFRIAVTVTQAGGAEATATAEGTCSGDVQRWRVTARAPAGGPVFVGGPAQVCASAQTRTGETVTDTHQWCREVTLLESAPPVYQRLVSALNHGDLEGALALVTDDAFLVGTFVCPPPDGCAGKAAVRRDFEAEIADRVQITPASVQVSGDTIALRLEYRADSVRAAGAERIIILGTVELRGGQISRGVFQPDPTDAQTAAFLAALAASQPAPAPAPTPRALPATGDGTCADEAGCE